MIIDVTNLWDLVTARSELSPEAEMLVDEQGRRLTFLEYQNQAEEKDHIKVFNDQPQ